MSPMGGGPGPATLTHGSKFQRGPAAHACAVGCEPCRTTATHVSSGISQLSAATLNRQISEYMKENVFVTTSGMAWAPAITFVQSVLGMDRVLYAMDYPYQFEPDEVIATDAVPLSEVDRKRLFQTNAERVFSL